MLGQAIMLVQGMGKHRGDGCAQVRNVGRGSRPRSGSMEGELAAAGAASSQIRCLLSHCGLRQRFLLSCVLLGEVSDKPFPKKGKQCLQIKVRPVCLY